MSREKSITVVVAGRPLPLKVQENEEPLVLAAAKSANDKINDFQRMYSTRDRNDCVAMALLTFALEHRRRELETEATDFSQQLNLIDQLLDDMLA